MRKSKLIGCLICLLAACCVFTSCDSAPAQQDVTTTAGEVTTTTSSGGRQPSASTTATTTPAATTAPEADPKDMPHDELLLLGGVNISSYKIVYGHSPVEDKLGSISGGTVWEDLTENSFTYDPETREKVHVEYLLGENRECEFDYESALRLQALIKELYGYELPVVKDTDANAESRYEILVGNTNRQATLNMIGRQYLETPQNLYLDEFVCDFNVNRHVETVEKKDEAGEVMKDEEGNVITEQVVTYVKTTQYVICGGSYGATWHAIDQIENYLKNPPVDTPQPVSDSDSDSPAPLVVDIKNAGDLSGAYDFKAVACLGDSITRGSQSVPDANVFGTATGFAQSVAGSALSRYLELFLSYPANLQRMLWKDYLICNYGQGNCTMTDPKPDEFPDGGPYYYNDFGSNNNTKFALCLSYSNREDFEFDAVLIMLGTNDAGQHSGTHKWSSALKDEYMDEAKNLIKQIKEGSPNAKFVMMNAPHRCDGDLALEKDTAMRKLQTATSQWLKNQGYDVYCYNMGLYTIENLSAEGACCQMPEDADEMSETELAAYLKEQELAAHQDYYNILTDSGTPDTTHPNFRGYNKIAEGMVSLLDYLLGDGEAPKYMINLE